LGQPVRQASALTHERGHASPKIVSNEHTNHLTAMFCSHPLGELTALPIPLDWVRQGPMGMKDRKGKGRQKQRVKGRKGGWSRKGPTLSSPVLGANATIG